MTEMLEQLTVWAGVGLTSVILLLVAALLAAIGWFQGRGARAAMTWSVTQGEVMESSVEQYQYSGDDGTSTGYRARIIYGYRVNGREYVGDRLHLGGEVHSSLSVFAENKARQYATGSKVQVYYDPKNPNEATLERGSPSTRLLYVIAAIMMLIAVGVCSSGFVFDSFLSGLPGF